MLTVPQIFGHKSLHTYGPRISVVSYLGSVHCQGNHLCLLKLYLHLGHGPEPDWHVFYQLACHFLMDWSALVH